MRKLLAEAIGTFALVLAGCGAIVINNVSGGAVTHVGVSLTFGLIVTAMIYSLGDVSGAHINPAMTLGLLASGRFPVRSVVPYIAAQLVGACAAAWLLKVMFSDHPNLGATLPTGPWQRAFVLEFCLTFLLMMTVLTTTVGPPEKTALAGLVIGGVVALEALFAGPISGASMNPARSLAPAFVSGSTEHWWIYVAAPVLGALAAVPVTGWMSPAKHDKASGR